MDAGLYPVAWEEHVGGKLPGSSWAKCKAPGYKFLEICPSFLGSSALQLLRAASLLQLQLLHHSWNTLCESLQDEVRHFLSFAPGLRALHRLCSRPECHRHLPGRQELAPAGFLPLHEPDPAVRQRLLGRHPRRGGPGLGFRQGHGQEPYPSQLEWQGSFQEDRPGHAWHPAELRTQWHRQEGQ